MIKLKITKIIEENEVIIETPYYYIHNLNGEYGQSVIYGKVLDDKIITIHKEVTNWSLHNKSFSYKIEIENVKYFDNMREYLTDQHHKSNKEEFYKIYKEALDFINQIKE